MGDYGHVLSHQTLNATASRDPGAGKAYLVLKHPRVMRLGAQARPRSGREVE
jgi:hypothetical protein